MDCRGARAGRDETSDEGWVKREHRDAAKSELVCVLDYLD